MWLHPVSVEKNVQTYISPKLCITPEIKSKYIRTGECVGIGQTTVPPIEKLRWRPPVPLSKTSSSCWNGTFNAQKFGNTCFQRSVTGPSAYDGSEDCLYLNVITPTLDPKAKKPVMVWVHGGSLQVLNGNWPLYSPTEQLASDTDVVYVGFNYRLQAFGFMALQLLADDSPTGTSGNYGFMDMILVLKWVQENIRNFGGDPNQVITDNK